MAKEYDDLFELVLESTLRFEPLSEEYFVAEESRIGKAAQNAYDSVKKSADDYRDAKSAHTDAKRSGDQSRISDTANRLKEARERSKEDIKKYRDLKQKADEKASNSFLNKMKNAASSAKTTANTKLFGGEPYEKAKKTASDFVNSSVAQEILGKKKDLEDEASSKAGILNKAKAKISAKKDFVKGAAVGGATGALVTGITKLLGVSLLSIAAIKAAGGVKRAGSGVMHMGKSKHELARAQAAELKANAKLSKAEAKRVYSDIKDKEKRFEMDMKRQKKEDKQAEIRAKAYEAEAKKLEEEVQRIEQEMKDTVAQFNTGKITKNEMQKKLMKLTSAAKNLVTKSKNAQKATEKDVTESVDINVYETEVATCILEYAADEMLESVDFAGVIDMITESFDI